MSASLRIKDVLSMVRHNKLDRTLGLVEAPAQFRYWFFLESMVLYLWHPVDVFLTCALPFSVDLVDILCNIFLISTFVGRLFNISDSLYL